MRLIDADALIEAHYRHCNEHHSDTDIFYGWSLELMQNAPTIDAMKIEPADVAPVRHGRWIVGEQMPMHDIKGNLSWGNWYTCNQCEFKTYAIEHHITQYNYCPNCGARMDGDADD